MAKETPAVDGPFVRRLNQLLEVSDKRNYEIAEEIGYGNSKGNIVTMFKRGLTRVPMGSVPRLAAALGADERSLLRLWLEQYQPELTPIFGRHMGTSISDNERDLLSAIRTETGDSDPHFTSADKKRIAKIAAQAASVSS